MRDGGLIAVSADGIEPIRAARLRALLIAALTLAVGGGDRVGALAVTKPRALRARIEVARVAHRGAPPPRSASRA